MSEQCIHGMNPAWCGTCLKQAKALAEAARRQGITMPIAPKGKKEKKIKSETKVKLKDLHPLVQKKVKEMVAGVPSKQADVREGVVMGDYAMVSLAGTDLQSKPDLFLHLDSTIKMIHINGYPFLWAIKKILLRAPNLKKIRLIPSTECRVTDGFKSLLSSHGVELVFGHHNPSMAWKEGEVRENSDYLTKKAILKSLDPSKKALLDELLQMGFIEAKVVVRYYCLDGKDQVSQRVVGKEMGLGSNSYISLLVNSTLAYLDPTCVLSNQATDRARGIKSRVLRVRDLLAQAEKMTEYLTRLGIDKIPEGMPMSHIDTLEALCAVWKTRAIEVLKEKDQRSYDMLCLRWGFADGKYHTLHEIGQMYGVTRERIRQLQERSFSSLGIDVDVD